MMDHWNWFGSLQTQETTFLLAWWMCLTGYAFKHLEINELVNRWESSGSTRFNSLWSRESVTFWRVQESLDPPGRIVKSLALDLKPSAEFSIGLFVHWWNGSESCLVMSYSLKSYGLCSPWNSLGQNTGVGSQPFSSRSSWPRNQTRVSCIAGGSFTNWVISSVKFSSLTQSCQTFCDPMNRSTPGLPVHHQFPEFKLMSIELVMPSSHLSSVVPFSSCPQSLPASDSFPMNQLFTWGGQSIGVSASAEWTPLNTQDWSPLGWMVGPLQSKGLSQVFSNTTVQKHQFFSTQLSSQSNSHIQTWPLEKP